MIDMFLCSVGRLSLLGLACLLSGIGWTMAQPTSDPTPHPLLCLRDSPARGTGGQFDRLH
jgi:hypothetical protein